MAETQSSGVTEALAKFALSLKYEVLPAEAVTEAKRGILDFVGVAIIGSTQKSTQIIRDACEPGADAIATVLGTKALTNLSNAALVNAYSAHALDYDDVQPVVGGHMSAATLAAILTLGESQGMSGRALITAYVAGFEIGCRVGKYKRFGYHLRDHGIHPTGFLCHFGSSSAAGKLLGLDVDQMKAAMGIAVGHASGVMKSFGTMCKGQNAGNAARNGLFSAQLAKRGFTGPMDIIEGHEGIYEMHGFKIDSDELTRDLGTKFEITANTFKPYACAGWRNPIIEAMVDLSTQHDLKAEDVKSVALTVCQQVSGLPNYPVPKTGLEGKFSAQYAAAIGLVDRAGSPPQFTNERVADPKPIALAKKITLTSDASLELNQVRVELKTNDGRTLNHFVAIPKGDFRKPLTWDDLAGKFRINASTVFPAARVAEIVAAVKNFDSCEDLRNFTRLCRPN